MDSVVRQLVGFRILMPRNVGDGKAQRLRQFATRPIQGVQGSVPTGVDSGHLLDYQQRVGKDMQGTSALGEGKLQCFQQGHVLGYVVVLAAYPSGQRGFTAGGVSYHDANSGGPGIAVRTAVDVSHQILHLLTSTMRATAEQGQDTTLMQTVEIVKSYCLVEISVDIPEI
jgi:hypothetical protein